MKKFSEGLDTAVFTTKYVINEGSPILVVYHYEDGSWQFNGKEANLNDDDFKIVSLEEILQNAYWWQLDCIQSPLYQCQI